MSQEFISQRPLNKNSNINDLGFDLPPIRSTVVNPEKVVGVESALWNKNPTMANKELEPLTRRLISKNNSPIRSQIKLKNKLKKVSFKLRGNGVSDDEISSSPSSPIRETQSMSTTAEIKERNLPLHIDEQVKKRRGSYALDPVRLDLNVLQRLNGGKSVFDSSDDSLEEIIEHEESNKSKEIFNKSSPIKRASSTSKSKRKDENDTNNANNIKIQKNDLINLKNQKIKELENKRDNLRSKAIKKQLKELTKPWQKLENDEPLKFKHILKNVKKLVESQYKDKFELAKVKKLPNYDQLKRSLAATHKSEKQVLFSKLNEYIASNSIEPMKTTRRNNVKKDDLLKSLQQQLKNVKDKKLQHVEKIKDLEKMVADLQVKEKELVDKIVDITEEKLNGDDISIRKTDDELSDVLSDDISSNSNSTSAKDKSSIEIKDKDKDKATDGVTLFIDSEDEFYTAAENSLAKEEGKVDKVKSAKSRSTKAKRKAESQEPEKPTKKQKLNLNLKPKTNSNPNSNSKSKVKANILDQLQFENPGGYWSKDEEDNLSKNAETEQINKASKPKESVTIRAVESVLFKTKKERGKDKRRKKREKAKLHSEETAIQVIDLEKDYDNDNNSGSGDGDDNGNGDEIEILENISTPKKETKVANPELKHEKHSQPTKPQEKNIVASTLTDRSMPCLQCKRYKKECNFVQPTCQNCRDNNRACIYSQSRSVNTTEVNKAVLKEVNHSLEKILRSAI
ncbi:hypothetical protein DAMA08_004580 [Martiniozyma asiatica (nom. inval.)]|nr:hypothetical protein DAMA08_004580 [Martiniozyma asiatica]